MCIPITFILKKKIEVVKKKIVIKTSIDSIVGRCLKLTSHKLNYHSLELTEPTQFI